jgi:hypothetical protein
MLQTCFELEAVVKAVNAKMTQSTYSMNSLANRGVSKVLIKNLLRQLMRLSIAAVAARVHVTATPKAPMPWSTALSVQMEQNVEKLEGNRNKQQRRQRRARKENKTQTWYGKKQVEIGGID